MYCSYRVGEGQNESHGYLQTRNGKPPTSRHASFEELQESGIVFPTRSAYNDKSPLFHVK